MDGGRRKTARERGNAISAVTSGMVSKRIARMLQQEEDPIQTWKRLEGGDWSWYGKSDGATIGH